MEDKAFIIKIKEGDKKTFEKLFRSYYPSLCHYAIRYVKTKEAAEEVVQELFLKIWKSRKTLNSDSNLSAYLYKATYTNCLAQLRKRKIRDRHNESISHLSNYATHQSELETDEINSLITKTLSQLPERTLQIFKMSRHEGLKYKEIADKLSISIKTVESNMGRALRMLRTNLKDYLGSI